MVRDARRPRKVRDAIADLSTGRRGCLAGRARQRDLPGPAARPARPARQRDLPGPAARPARSAGRPALPPRPGRPACPGPAQPAGSASARAAGTNDDRPAAGRFGCCRRAARPAVGTVRARPPRFRTGRPVRGPTAAVLATSPTCYDVWATSSSRLRVRCAGVMRSKRSPAPTRLSSQMSGSGPATGNSGGGAYAHVAYADRSAGLDAIWRRGLSSWFGNPLEVVGV
jgi:hypothetical protein